ncbi:hypothetical protein DFQ04_2161 [Algoriphagus boseongensis]|uniref:DUF1735 domain-containing protein n=1 Tax=Algoriphagus boseongensis TaxID=1442587 RepID=A0A4R6T9F4_9BACT|nr:hypothetical protein [Algoriphagus boseongensis]TDQ17507.1 hypothetical protein DFQ04_2161 [Algoriphagus boseongensis]
MKMLKYSFGLFAMALVFLSSCRDTIEPNVPYTTFDNGAYLRTIARTSTTFNFFDLASSKFALTLEAVDKEDGATVQTVEIRVRHRRLIPGVGLKYTPAQDVLVKTLQSADFKPNDQSRFLRTSFEVTAAEAIKAVGLTNADIDGGDVFEFRLVLNDKFGRRFSSDNVTTNVAGAPFYASPFQYPVNVVCPSDLGGTYTFDHLETFCGKVFSGSTTWTKQSNGVSYTVSDGTFGSWQACYPDTWGSGNVRINDACGRLTMTGTDKYGDSYSMTVLSATPQVLTFEWVNTYGEFGTVAVKSNAGKPWPALK